MIWVEIDEFCGGDRSGLDLAVGKLHMLLHKDVMVGQQLDKEKKEVLEKIKQKKEAPEWHAPSGNITQAICCLDRK